MTPPVPTVSLLLPNRNNDRMLDHVLDRLATHTTYAATEVVAVDDGSTDGSREILRRWRDSGRFPAFRLIEKPASGVVDTLNAALDAASGDVCVQLDADASVETPGWVERMLELLLIDARVGVVVAKVVMDTGQIHACGIDAVSPEGLRDRGATITEPVGQRRWHWRMTHPEEGTTGELEARVAEVDSGIGVCMMYWRADALAAGGYDPGYAPVWFDDLDLCLSIRARGKKVFFLPDVRVVHHLAGRNPPVPRTIGRRLAEHAIRTGRRVVPAPVLGWIRSRRHFGTHTPEQLERLRHHYAYWRSKWGWDLLNPDMAAIRDQWGETEIWWAGDPARRTGGRQIIERFESAARTERAPTQAPRGSTLAE
jgi:glycosyltransferase involved in cell wall biosynthesis